MNTIFYPAIFHPEETGYSVSVPDIEGCFTQGEDMEEAVSMAKEAVDLMLEDKSELPKPSSVETVQLQREDIMVKVPFNPAEGKFFFIPGDCIIVLDPTFLVDVSEFIPQIDYPTEPYIAVYTYHFDERKIKIVKEFSQRVGMKIVSLGQKFAWCDEGIPCTPFSFLGYSQDRTGVTFPKSSGMWQRTHIQLSSQGMILKRCKKS